VSLGSLPLRAILQRSSFVRYSKGRVSTPFSGIMQTTVLDARVCSKLPTLLPSSFDMLFDVSYTATTHGPPCHKTMGRARSQRWEMCRVNRNVGAQKYTKRLLVGHCVFWGEPIPRANDGSQCPPFHDFVEVATSKCSGAREGM